MVNFGERRHHFASKAAFYFRPELRFYNDHNSTANIRYGLPTLDLQFNLFARQDAWRKSPINQPSQLIYLDEFYKFENRSFDVKICRSQYTSYHVFYSILEQHLTNWGDYYELCHAYIINRMIVCIIKLIKDELNKGSNGQYLEIFVYMTLKLEYVLDGRIQGIPWRLNEGMMPASKTSIMELLERMEIDDDQCLKDLECVICLEQLEEGGGKIVSMPCSHMFHGDCITTWLNKSHYCPVCRYDLPTP